MQNSRHPHQAIIAFLERLGPGLTTVVSVNGRQLCGDAAIKLIMALPAEATVWQQNRVITIQPDPFGLPFASATRDAADLVTRLLARQEVADRTRHWWQRLARRKT